MFFSYIFLFLLSLAIVVMSAGTRRRPVNLPVTQSVPQQATQEDDSRWQDIIKRSGLLKINGQVSE